MWPSQTRAAGAETWCCYFTSLAHGCTELRLPKCIMGRISRLAGALWHVHRWETLGAFSFVLIFGTWYEIPLKQREAVPAVRAHHNRSVDAWLMLLWGPPPHLPSPTGWYFSTAVFEPTLPSSDEKWSSSLEMLFSDMHCIVHYIDHWVK